jgi:hypothetical protein
VNSSIHDLAKRRYSCRNYIERPLADSDREALAQFLASIEPGPLGNGCRFALLAATQSDRDSLKGLGTYGFIKGATGFIVGAVRPGAGDMEDCGYCLERAVLAATDLGLGTCWLGGTFTKSAFARKIGAARDEVVPAVIAVGYPAENSRVNWVRRSAGSDHRLRTEQLFFEASPGEPLDLSREGGYAAALEVVRWAPSASNKQPWRLARSGETWRFYLQRTRGYGKSTVFSFIKMADLQRVDIGIAMCHFELAVRESGLTGGWVVEQSRSDAAFAAWEYTVSWISKGS